MKIEVTRREDGNTIRVESNLIRPYHTAIAFRWLGFTTLKNEKLEKLIERAKAVKEVGKTLTGENDKFIFSVTTD